MTLNKNKLSMVVFLTGIILCMGFTIAYWSEGWTSYERYTAGNDVSRDFGTVAGTPKTLCQVFTVGITGTNENFIPRGFSYKGTGDVTTVNNVSVYIVNVDGTGVPDMSDVIAQNISFVIPNSDAVIWRNVTINTTSQLAKNGNYAVCINSTQTTFADVPYWHKDNSSASYSGGSAYEQAIGGTWTNVTGADFLFNISGVIGTGNTVQLNTPNDEASFLENVTFNCSGQDDISVTNLTLKIDDVVNFTQLGGGLNFTNFEIDVTGFSTGTHNWTCKVTDNVNNSVVSATRTFNMTSFIENSNTFVGNTTEGSSERFELNVSIKRGLQISAATLFYNDTTAVGTLTQIVGNNYSISTNLIIPGVTAATNNTFHWQLTLNDGFKGNSTFNNQSVKNLAMDNCTALTTLVLNYTLRDEETQTILTGLGPINSSIEVDVQVFPLGSTTAILNFSQNFVNSSDATVCFSAGSLDSASYRLEAQTRYTDDIRAAEFHHLQNFSLANGSVPQTIGLYDLRNTSSTTFLISFKNDNFAPVGGALIDITRKYVSDGVFRSVEIPKTDPGGQATGHFDTEGTIYTIIVSKHGKILATFDNVAVACQDKLIGDCILLLNAPSSTIELPDWDKIGNVSYVFNFTPLTRTVSVIFSTTDHGSKVISLNITKFDNWGNRTFCSGDQSTQIESSAGTLSCSVPSSYGNITILAQLYSDGTLLTNRIYSIKPDPKEIFGPDGAMMVVILMITIPLMLSGSPIGMVIGVFIGIVMSVMLGLLKSDSLIGSGSIVLFAAFAIGVIIWKLAQKEET